MVLTGCGTKLSYKEDHNSNILYSIICHPSSASTKTADVALMLSKAFRIGKAFRISSRSSSRSLQREGQVCVIYIWCVCVKSSWKTHTRQEQKLSPSMRTTYMPISLYWPIQIPHSDGLGFMWMQSFRKSSRVKVRLKSCHVVGCSSMGPQPLWQYRTGWMEQNSQLLNTFKQNCIPKAVWKIYANAKFQCNTYSGLKHSA